MYGYENHIEITVEQLFQKITQQQIFEFVLKQPFSFSERYLSPFREDKRPGCRFEEREDGAIVFVDFGERFSNPPRTHRSAIGMVMDKFGVSVDGAVRKICEHFNLSTEAKDYQAITFSTAYKVNENGSFKRITYNPKQFTRADIWYWSQSLIKIDHLLEDNVFAARSFTVLKDGKLKLVNVYKYCYAIDFVDRVKIYQPFSEKYKWITNCDENNIGNFDNLPPTGDEVIIQKSYKDHRVLRNLEWSLNVIWFQNEGCVPSIEILVNLTIRFKLITIFYDNDEGGIKAAIKLLDIFNTIREGCARMVYLPIFTSRPTWKDPSEFIFKEGRQDLQTVLNQIGIYGKTT